MAKPRKGDPVNGDKVRRTDTGQVGWFVQSHQKGATTVLPEGTNVSTVWEPGTPMEVLPGEAPW